MISVEKKFLWQIEKKLLLNYLEAIISLEIYQMNLGQKMKKKNFKRISSLKMTIFSKGIITLI